MQDALAGAAFGVYEFILPIYGLTFLACVLIVLPMSLFRRTRARAGVLLYLASWIFGIVTWLWCAVVTLLAWNWVVLLIGILFFGIGVVPLAMLGVVVAGEWVALLGIVVAVAMVFAARIGGAVLIEMAATPEAHGAG